MANYEDIKRKGAYKEIEEIYKDIKSIHKDIKKKELTFKKALKGLHKYKKG